MFSSSKPKEEKIELKINGMHCTSCAMNIDGTLEDVDGVLESTTNYATQNTIIRYDPQKVGYTALKKAIYDLGYSIQESTS